MADRATTVFAHEFGRTPADAFKRARARARGATHHIAGPTGTLLEKDSYVRIPPGEVGDQPAGYVAGRLLAESDPRVAGVDRPAGVIEADRQGGFARRLAERTTRRIAASESFWVVFGIVPAGGRPTPLDRSGGQASEAAPPARSSTR